WKKSWNSSRGGAGSGGQRTTRAGSGPPSSLRRCSRYLISLVSCGGRVPRPPAPPASGAGVPARGRDPGHSAPVGVFLRCAEVWVELLPRVGDVAAVPRLAQPVALDRVRQDDRGRAAVLDGDLVGGVHLLRVVPAARQLAQLLVGHVLDHLEQLGVLAEEVLP